MGNAEAAIAEFLLNTFIEVVKLMGRDRARATLDKLDAIDAAANADFARRHPGEEGP